MWSKWTRKPCPASASDYSWTEEERRNWYLPAAPLESAEIQPTLLQMNDTQEDLKDFSWKSSLNNWEGIATRWNTSILVITCSQLLTISSSASEGLTRLSRQSVITGKGFNPYCNLPGNNHETLIVSKLFSAGTCHWFTSEYAIWSFLFPMTKELDNVFYWCHCSDNIWCCSILKVILHNFELSTFKSLT